MKRVLSVILCIAATAGALMLSGCFQFISSLSDYSSYPALWIVEDQDGHRCYLFGTNNTGKDDTLFPLPDVIEDAYSYCSAVASECDLTEEQDGAPATYTDGTTIKDHLSERVYNAAVSFITAKEGEYDEKYDKYTAAEWYSMIERYSIKTYGYSTEYGTDRYILNKAKTDGKKIYELEGASRQSELVGSVSDEVYEYFIISTLNNRGSTSYDYYDQLYRTGEMRALERAVEGSRNAVYPDAALKAKMDEYYSIMLVGRNKAMAEEVLKYLSDGERVFVAVASSHIVGTDGIAEILRSNGCKIIRK